MRRSVLPCLFLLALAGGCHRQAPPPPQAQPAAQAAPAAPAAADKIDASQAGKALPALEIRDGDDKPVKLSALKGKPVLLNLWATWCVPCVKELPTLDALAARTGDRLALVTASEDLEGRRVVLPFFAKHGFKAIKPWTDTSNALLLQLKEAGLPVTILYGADGKEVARVHGDMDWTGPDAAKLLAQAGI